jgi:hypothetical protein
MLHLFDRSLLSVYIGLIDRQPGFPCTVHCGTWVVDMNFCQYWSTKIDNLDFCLHGATKTAWILFQATEIDSLDILYTVLLKGQSHQKCVPNRYTGT